jgi:hypothetical protein
MRTGSPLAHRLKLSTRLDAIVEATTRLRLSASTRLALEEAALAVRGRNVPKFLGEGMEGQAYALPDDFAIKVTSSKDVARIARKLLHKPQRNFVRVYAVEPLSRRGSKTVYNIYMENLSPAPKQWKAFANAVWAGAFNKRPGSLAKRYLRQAGALPPKVRWYRNLLAQAKALRLPHLDVHEDNIMMRGRVPVMIDP